MLNSNKKQASILYTTLGLAPKAVANSISWLVYKYPDLNVEEIRLLASTEDLEAQSLDVKKFLDDVHKYLEENTTHMWKKHTKDTVFANTTFKIQLEIPKAPLPTIIEHVIRQLTQLHEPDKALILDITPGRKVMSVALTIAGLYLAKEFHYNVYIYYYWLREYSREAMHKMAYELSIDEIDTQLISPVELDHALKKIQRTT